MLLISKTYKNMIFNSSMWTNEFPHVLNHKRTTLRLSSSIEPTIQKTLLEFFNTSSYTGRSTKVITLGENKFFAKKERLDSFKKRWRVFYGHKKSKDIYDWPVEEIINTHNAFKKCSQTLPLSGFGHTRDQIGLVKDIFLLTPYLETHTDGIKILEKSPEKISWVISSTFHLLHSLHQAGIVHMDLWAANVMLPIARNLSPIAIDLENSFHSKTQHLEKVLGFQMGFFYRNQIYRYITEKDYDSIVEKSIHELFPSMCRSKFQQTYSLSKTNFYSRLQRRNIHLNGTL